MSISRIKNRISEAATEACGYSPLTKVVSEEEINRILEQESGWIPVDEQIPNTDKYILVSFENFTIPDIGRYETDEDGNGAFYPGDDDKSYAKYGLFVNAWMPLRSRTWKARDNNGIWLYQSFFQRAERSQTT